MKQVNTFVFAVLMFAAICLCIFSVANAAPANAPANDSIPTMTKHEFCEYLAENCGIEEPTTDSTVINFFTITDNSWYEISVSFWHVYLDNIDEATNAVNVWRRYDGEVLFEDILDLD